MSSSKPYLIRAISEWITENGLTPHVLVKASFPGTVIPVQFAHDDRIVLNISATAAHNLSLGNEQISFVARFSGKPCEIWIPVGAIMAVYARENGKGMVFEGDEITSQSQPEKALTEPKKPVLTVIK